MKDASNQLDFGFPADDLLEFPRDIGEQGYFQFHSEQKQAFLALEEKYNITLNRRVRLRLAGWDGELEGKIVLDSLLLPASDEETVRLRLGKAVFDHTDIECCQVLD